MEKIEPGKYVELAYELFSVAPDGTETKVHETDPSDPEKIIFGVTPGVIRPLEEAIDGLEKGGTFDIKVKSDEAFGPVDPDNIVELDKNIFVVDGKFDDKMVAPGRYVPMMTADGFKINGKVLEVTDTNVKLDFNHPLAGKDVRFKGSVLAVRPATPEELTPAQGCGGCGGGCGEGGSCGDTCGCDGGCGCN